MKKVTACIVTIGDEILIGQTLDTNSQYIAKLLVEIGVSVEKMLTIPDTHEAIFSTLTHCIENYDITLTTGGLGPTSDDITKKTITDIFGAKLILNQDVLQDVKELVERKGRTLTVNNKQQALVPENCEVLRNKRGTAPGMWFNRNGHILVNMPGVPFEMKGLIEQVIPKIKETFSLPVIVYKMVYTIGIPEAVLATKLEQWEKQLPSFIRLAYLPSPGRVKLRLQAQGDNKAELEKQIDKEIEKLFAIIPEYIYSTEKENLSEVLGDLLRNKKLTLATAESCTGGYLAHLITSISGSSDYYKGSIISYSNEVKMNLLDVSPKVLETQGAVSEPVVIQMAKAVAQKLNTDCSIATSGIAGPTGGTPEKPVGTVWIAVYYKGEIITKKYVFTTNRSINIELASLMGMNMLRKMILGK
ncbi:MAG TPA: competence/damage-inducible protein A [Flavobacteriales bacterium]|nr:competence/damage-inducible protein A [Flavobacteriales bacterium]